ncbi:MAG: type II toxin-antitoxin system VapC family toxin [Microcoleaceae cyanobacterium]
MIVLDTHIWIWWINGDPQLTQEYQDYIQSQESQGLGISIISCWEIAKLVERNRLILSIPVDQWLDQALAYPGICLLDLTPNICVESTQLPGKFHRDPADQMIVATARVYDCSLVTMDSKILSYIHVQTQPSASS